jgi:hypothetical protein
MLKQLLPAFVCSLVLLTIAGCGGVTRPETIKVTGSVTYKGQPVADAEVNFWGANAPRAASGVTDAEGKFTLSMFESGDGCLAGENVITIVKLDPSSVKPVVSPEAMMNDPAAMAKMSGQDMANANGPVGPKSLVPEKYTKRNLTPLKETVSDENNSFPFTLTD